MDDEVGALLDGEVLATERRDGRIAAGNGTFPRLPRLHRLAAGELFVLYALRKEVTFGPPPHHTTNGVDDGEVVCLTIGEVELDVLGTGVRDVEREADSALLDLDVQARLDLHRRAGGTGATGDFFQRDRRARLDWDCASERSRGFGMRARAAGEG